MTGPEHYKKAQEILARRSDPAWKGYPDADLFAEAQVHAMLALAAATAMAAHDESGMAIVDFEAWDKACGEPGGR